VTEKIAAENDKIESRYILRDENLDPMNRFHTAGARSIPKLIVSDAATHEVLGLWGARPTAAKELYLGLKESLKEKSATMEELQRWYNADGSMSMQNEFSGLLLEICGRRCGSGVA
jgi:hypothetical protein